MVLNSANGKADHTRHERCQPSCHVPVDAVDFAAMHNEFTALIEPDGEWFVAYCPELPEANGQGRTPAEAKEDLAAAISLVREDRQAPAGSLRGIAGGLMKRQVIQIVGRPLRLP